MKMRPKLKGLHSPDLFNLEEVNIVDNNQPFCILVQAMIGPEDGPGEESFDILVCNRKWIDIESREGRLHSEYILIQENYDPNEIKRYWHQAIIMSAGKNWDEVAEKLSSFGKWEFDEYKY